MTKGVGAQNHLSKIRRLCTYRAFFSDYPGEGGIEFIAIVTSTIKNFRKKTATIPGKIAPRISSQVKLFIDLKYMGSAKHLP